MTGLHHVVMEQLHDRINRVINTRALEATLAAYDLDLIDLQFDWSKSKGDFKNLPEAYQKAILAGEAELQELGEVVLA